MLLSKAFGSYNTDLVPTLDLIVPQSLLLLWREYYDIGKAVVQHLKSDIIEAVVIWVGAKQQYTQRTFSKKKTVWQSCSWILNAFNSLDGQRNQIIWWNNSRWSDCWVMSFIASTNPQDAYWYHKFNYFLHTFEWNWPSSPISRRPSYAISLSLLPALCDGRNCNDHEEL